MNPVRIILVHEFVSIVRRRSFLFLVVGCPCWPPLVAGFLNISAPTEEDIVSLAMP